jgi:hypothetical protein
MTELPVILTINGYRLENVGGDNYAIAYDIPNATVLCGTINPDGTYTISGGVDVEYTDDNGEPTGETWTLDTRLPEITTANPITAMTALACAVAVTEVIA